MKNRLDEIDLMRAISTLAVIMIHVSGIYVTYSSLAYHTNQIMRFAVPLFVLLSGFSLYYVDLRRSPDSYAGFVLKRLKKVFIPYVIWSVIIMIHQHLNGKTINLKSAVNNLIHGQANYHLYFIIIIMQLYLLYPLLRKLFARYGPFILAASFLITAYYQTAIYLKAIKINILPLNKLFFENYNILFTWVFFFALGMYLAKNIERIKLVLKYEWIICVFWIAASALVIADSKIPGAFELSIRPSVMLYAVVSFFFIYCVCSIINTYFEKLKNILIWISGSSFFIYFSHASILGIFYMNIKPGSLGFLFDRGWGMIIVFLLICSICFILSFLISFLPFHSYLGCRKINMKKALNVNIYESKDEGSREKAV